MHEWTEVVDLFRLRGETLCLWDYLTALRGPDVDPDNEESRIFKALTTCVVRGKCGEAWGITITEAILKIYPRGVILKALSKLYAREFEHFRVHFLNGLQALATYYWLKGKPQLVKLFDEMYQSLVQGDTEKYLTLVEELLKK